MKGIIGQLIICVLFVSTLFGNPSDTLTDNNTFGYERHTGTTLIVHAINGLKLRLEPSFKAQTITVLDYGEALTLLGDTPEGEPFNIGYATGKWVHVDVNGIDGYVFDGFTSTLPIPEVIPHTTYLTTVLERYAHGNFKLLTTDTIARSSEMDERFHVKYKFTFEDNIRMNYNAYWQSESIRLDIPNIRIMDAYHLVKALLTVSDLKHLYGQELVFKINDYGHIYEISDRFKEDIIIRDRGEFISIEFKTYVGC